MHKFQLKIAPFPLSVLYSTSFSTSLHNSRWLPNSEWFSLLDTMNQFVSCNGVISRFISHVWCLLSKLQFNVQDGVFSFFNRYIHYKNIWTSPLVQLPARSTGSMTVRPVINWKCSCLYVDIGTEFAALKQ